MASNPMALKFAVLPKAGSTDPILARRNKIVARLQQQKELAENPNYKIPRQKWVTNAEGIKELREQPKKCSPWWRVDGAGNLLMTIRYGARPLELTKGMHAIMVGKREALPGVIDAAVEAIQRGDFDSQLSQASKTAVQMKGK